MIVLLLVVALLGPARVYHRVTVADLPSTVWTHVDVEGLVVYIRTQHDGDVHITIAAGGKLAVVEIVPAIPLPTPRRGSWIRVRGISRWDRAHRWPEINPAESVDVIRAPRPRHGHSTSE